MEEKIEFQYITDSRIYRRKMIVTRVVIGLIVAGGLAVTGITNLILGIVLPVIALFLTAIWVISGLQHEMNYTIYNTRFVIKNKEKRISIPLENVISVEYRSAFYEKKYCSGTMTVKARAADTLKVRTYKFKHIFDGKAGADYIAAAIERNNNGEKTNGEKD